MNVSPHNYTFQTAFAAAPVFRLLYFYGLCFLGGTAVSSDSESDSDDEVIDDNAKDIYDENDESSDDDGILRTGTVDKGFKRLGNHKSNSRNYFCNDPRRLCEMFWSTGNYQNYSKTGLKHKISALQKLCEKTTL